MGAPAVTPLRGDLPPAGDTPFHLRGGRSSASSGGGRPPVARPPSDAPLLHPLVARLIGFVPLAVFGALHWMGMVEPALPERAWRAVGVGLLIAGGLIALRRLPRRLQPLAAIAVTAAGLALALLAGGVADEQLRPSVWGDLSAAIGRGIDGLPGTRTPYRGLDPDVQLVIPLGGAVLVALAAALAFWPRRRRTGFAGAALVLLVALYAVPAVALIHDSEFVRGAVLLVLVIAFLRLDRLRRRDALPAAGFAVVTAVGALALAPALDTDNPWWDYENWSQSQAGSKSTTFAWDHEYGPLDWPRDGRELLRIRSPNRAYWKADALDEFDGRRWVHTESGAEPWWLGFSTAGIEVSNLRRWSFDVAINVRNLRSETIPIAGVADSIYLPRRAPVQVRPGIFAVGSRDLRRGDAYRATVYVPQPSVREMRNAGTTYSTAPVEPFTHFTIEVGPGREGELAPLAGRLLPVAVRGFGAQPVRLSLTSPPAAELLESSNVARTYRLSRRLLAGASTPYEYVRAIERHLGEGFSYSETPPKESQTLDGFLFDGKIGYCQQFSGAMALLLRMGGVPARVITGFSPGSLDRENRQYVVRDLDAHSWVEAWFPGVGWVVFDPTPSTAPPRSQASGSILPSAGLGDARDLGQTRAALGTARVQEPVDRPWELIIGGPIAAIALALLGRGLIRRNRAMRKAPPTSELERALRIAGGGLTPSTTLSALEARFAGSPPAAGYVRALRAQRYAPRGGGPTPAQRRGLRRALGRGGGPLGWLRAVRAVPPRLSARRTRA